MEYLWLWIGTIGFALAAAYFASLIPQASSESRHFYYITFAISLIAAISYLTMATDKGTVAVVRDGVQRTFFYARYVDWTLTTPLLLLDIALLGLARPARHVGLIGAIVGLDLAMIGFGLLGGSDGGALRYIWWVLGTLAMVLLLNLLITQVGASARTQGSAVSSQFRTISTLTLVLWACYPIVFLLGTEGFNAIGAPIEVLLYMVLDWAAKIGFGYVLLSNRAALQQASAQISARAARPRRQMA